jgi:hypothetical protein
MTVKADGTHIFLPLAFKELMQKNVTHCLHNHLVSIVVVHVDAMRPSLNCHQQRAYCPLPRSSMSMEPR